MLKMMFFFLITIFVNLFGFDYKHKKVGHEKILRDATIAVERPRDARVVHFGNLESKKQRIVYNIYSYFKMAMPMVKFNDGRMFPAFGLGTWQPQEHSVLNLHSWRWASQNIYLENLAYIRHALARRLGEDMMSIFNDNLLTIPQSKPGEVEQAVKDAIIAGYRHIDGAHVYENEQEVGAALSEVMKQGVVKREDLYITSKLWCTYHQPDMVEGAIKTTLKNLGLEYLDLYLVHWPQGFKEGDVLFPRENDKIIYSDVDYIDTWKAMEALVDKGLAKSIGVSNFNKSQLDRLLGVAKIKPVTNQVEVHPYLNQQKLADYCSSLDIVITAYSPLGSPGTPRSKPEDIPLLENSLLKEIADKYNKSVPQLLIRYAIDRGMIVIPKSVTKSRIIHNMEVFHFKLTSDDMGRIGALDKNGRFCTMGDIDHKYYPFKEEF